jgi:tRNA A-37 threonylcarbamoyl transferase component Bud32
MRPQTNRQSSALTQVFKRFRRGKPSRNPLLMATILATVLALVGGRWIHAKVKHSLREVIAENLETILEANVTSLSLWIEHERGLVRSWAQAPTVERDTAALLNCQRSTPEQLPALAGSQEILATLTRVAEENAYLGYVLVSENGVVLSAADIDVVGQQVPDGMLPIIRRVFEGQALMSEPFRGREASVLLMAVFSPVVDTDGKPVAALAFIIDPETDFTRILSVAQMGESGHTYAFSRSALLLSDCRFEEQLRQVGLLDEDRGVSSALNVNIRYPGGDTTRGFVPAGTAESWPMTTMAASAVQGDSGLDLDGYYDFRGVKVVGAWQWLEEYDLGIATEVNKAQAFAPLRTLQIVFGALGFGLGGLGAALLANSWLNLHLRRKIDTIQQLGQYTLTRKIGQGGMAEVYLARHAMLHRPTAIKLIRGPDVTEDMIQRFEREVQLTCELTHPNTIEIYDYGRTPDGVFYYAMEYLEGLTLADLVEQGGPLPVSRAIHMLRQACASLAEAHAIGLIHRDIKPLNIFVCRRGGLEDVIKVLDFGLVKDIATGKELQITQGNAVTGTPMYMSPERLRDPESVDTRSDIFSLGAVAFVLLTGRDAFQGSSPADICYQVLREEAPKVSQCAPVAIPPALDALIDRCLAKDAADRPATVGAIIDALDAISGITPWTQADADAWWGAYHEQHDSHEQHRSDNSTPTGPLDA